jgi:1-acyl-sn-glycerol-3-phosphate acyltransferase
MLFDSLIALAIVTTLIYGVAVPGASFVALLLVLLGSFALYNAIFVLIVFFTGVFLPDTFPVSRVNRWAYTCAVLVGQWMCGWCGVKPRFTGEEKLPEGRFLYVCNHRSIFDPLTVFGWLGAHEISFVAKPSLFTFPPMSHLLHAGGHMAIDRDNARAAMTTIQTAADYLKNDMCSIGIYPEGTRTKTGNLQEFHAGSFKAAQKAHVPVVIMATENSEQVLKNFPFRRTNVVLTILETIDADEVKATKTAALAEHTKALLLEYLGH